MELKTEFNSQLKLIECHPILIVRIFFNNQILFKKYCVCTPQLIKEVFFSLKSRKSHPKIKKKKINSNVSTGQPTKP